MVPDNFEPYTAYRDEIYDINEWKTALRTIFKENGLIKHITDISTKNLYLDIFSIRNKGGIKCLYSKNKGPKIKIKEADGDHFYDVTISSIGMKPEEFHSLMDHIEPKIGEFLNFQSITRNLNLNTS